MYIGSVDVLPSVRLNTVLKYCMFVCLRGLSICSYITWNVKLMSLFFSICRLCCRIIPNHTKCKKWWDRKGIQGIGRYDTRSYEFHPGKATKKWGYKNMIEKKWLSMFHLLQVWYYTCDCILYWIHRVAFISVKVVIGYCYIKIKTQYYVHVKYHNQSLYNAPLLKIPLYDNHAFWIKLLTPPSKKILIQYLRYKIISILLEDTYCAWEE